MTEDGSPDVTPVPSGMLFFRPAGEGDLVRLVELETAGYPADEAASAEQLAYRMREAPELFLCAIEADPAEGDTVIGFVCGTATDEAELKDESMSVHVPGGHSACIHSVCVDGGRRRRGVASKMLAAYMQYVRGGGAGLERARLICKAPLVGLYEAAGFSVVGPSPIVHGADPWIEMVCEF